LQQVESEAVLGDLAESSESGPKAMASVFGLVIRRFLAFWQDWRPWVALTALILPLSLLLSTVSQTAMGESAVYTWMYVNNWDWQLTKNPGFWYVLRGAATQLGLECLLLACWSWSAGFLLGRLPNKILRTSRNLLLLLLGISLLANIPQNFVQLVMHFSGVPPLSSDPNAPVTAISVYRVIFPWMVLLTLVVLPVSSGMRRAVQSLTLSRKVRIFLSTAAIVSALTTLLRVPGFGFLFGASGSQWLWRHRDTVGVLPLVAYWPTLYVIALGLKRPGATKLSWRSSP
jgi:hypothetical protein